MNKEASNKETFRQQKADIESELALLQDNIKKEFQGIEQILKNNPKSWSGIGRGAELDMLLSELRDINSQIG